MLALRGFYTVPRYPEEDYRPLLARVGAEQGPGDGWLAVYPWQIGFLRAYLPDAHPTPIAAELAWEGEPQALERDLERLLVAHPRLWFPAYQVKGRLFEEEVVAALARTGVVAWDEWEGNTRVYLVGAAPPPPRCCRSAPSEGAGEFRAALGAGPVPSGVGIVPLFFQVEGGGSGLRASAQLVGRGSVWGEWDGEVEEGVVRAGLPVRAGTPPGDYEVSA